MKKETLYQTLTRLDACEEAKEWAKGKSLNRAWSTCKRGDWMIWLLISKGGSRDDKRLRLIACDIAESVLCHARECDRPVLEAAIAASRKYAICDASCAAGAALSKAMIAARSAASSAASSAADAAWSAADAASSAASSAARSAADAARSASWSAASSAADAAISADRSAASSAADAAWSAASRIHADIVRRHYPEPPALLGEGE